MEKKVYIELLGCAKNQVDAEIMLAHLVKAGYKRALKVEEADLIIVNTCGFIESAKKEAIDTFFSLYSSYKDKKFILSGCLAQRYGNTMKLDEADGIFGNRQLSNIVRVANSVLQGEKVVSIEDYPVTDTETYERVHIYGYKSAAYLKISEGCNHRCRYCAIPLIRGGLRSVEFDTVINQAKNLIAQGVYEISVVAQDLAAYGLDLYSKSRFIELMDALSDLEGDFVLRMLYIHPDFFPYEILDLVKRKKKILPYFDIPIQHVNPSVLTKMARFGSYESYLKMFKRIREELPLAVIRTTIMLGFTNENSQTLEEIHSFLSSAKLDWVGFFLYSCEEDTPAFSDSSAKELKERINLAAEKLPILMDEQQKISEKALQRFIGLKTTMLIEEKVKESNLYIGRTFAQAADVDGLVVLESNDEYEPGDIVKIKIDSVRGLDLKVKNDR